MFPSPYAFTPSTPMTIQDSIDQYLGIIVATYIDDKILKISILTVLFLNRRFFQEYFSSCHASSRIRRWTCVPLPLAYPHKRYERYCQPITTHDIYLGIFFVLPCIESYQKVDLRTITLCVPPQEVLWTNNYLSQQIVRIVRIVRFYELYDGKFLRIHHMWLGNCAKIFFFGHFFLCTLARRYFRLLVSHFFIQVIRRYANIFSR